MFNNGEYSSNWRDSQKNSLIWRQVDVAKVLISLQGDFDQVFFADIDFASLIVNSSDVQTMLKKHGILFRGFLHEDKANFENQLWGFTKERRGFFERLYVNTLQSAHDGLNGYHAFIDQIKGDLENEEGIDTKDICFVGEHDGSSAYHPGHTWSHGNSLQESYVYRLNNEFSLENLLPFESITRSYLDR